MLYQLLVDCMDRYCTQHRLHRPEKQFFQGVNALNYVQFFNTSVMTCLPLPERQREDLMAHGYQVVLLSSEKGKIAIGEFLGYLPEMSDEKETSHSALLWLQMYGELEAP